VGGVVGGGGVHARVEHVPVGEVKPGAAVVVPYRSSCLEC